MDAYISSFPYFFIKLRGAFFINQLNGPLDAKLVNLLEQYFYHAGKHAEAQAELFLQHVLFQYSGF